ncbi:toluene tolerance protein [Pseudomonas sp. JBR1]|uniref:toluene tolerance protein n=1 Tax=Pseudomonas sp. JBR1 TaxID=3020907 RepID=UPI0023060C1A|nr:toluene tolerance protein [Pseudomonas sp. JBR1]WCE08250.1 toluene tolerance protein [Pseudomonas sp. JBR1]
MNPIENQQFLELRKGARVVEEDAHGEKVLQLPDGTYLKLFRRKRLLTSAALYPYAQRFADNTRRLALLGIPCPHILAVYRIASILRDAVHYEPLPGQTIRELLTEDNAELRVQLARFIATLHEHGIYFRSLHLGNIVLTPARALGLIDVADLRCLDAPLSRRMRLRNFHHLLRYPQDSAWLLQDDALTFIQAYLASSSIQLKAEAFWRQLGSIGKSAP